MFFYCDRNGNGKIGSTQSRQNLVTFNKLKYGQASDSLANLLREINVNKSNYLLRTAQNITTKRTTTSTS